MTSSSVDVQANIPLLSVKSSSLSCRTEDTAEDLNINAIPDPPEDVPDFPTLEEQIQFLRANPGPTANFQVLSFFQDRGQFLEQ
jgi:hypothetical protein